MSPRILIIEDEVAIRDMVCLALARAQMQTIAVGDSQKALALIKSATAPDLILMDWMLPGVSGIDLVRQLRQAESTRQIPIIMLTARGDECDRVNGLDSGVDDYLTKPFSVRELIARIQAVLRRTQPNSLPNHQIEWGALRIDEAAQRVFSGSTPITIAPTEYRLLHFLATHPERVYSRGQLLDYVWGTNAYLEERTVDVHIGRLRKTLAPFNLDHMVQTVRSSGYRFSHAR
jgi:two-component system phosphate regulon response regulator PhoB